MKERCNSPAFDKRAVLEQKLQTLARTSHTQKNKTATGSN